MLSAENFAQNAKHEGKSYRIYPNSHTNKHDQQV